MSTHKYIDRVCVAAVILSLLLTAVFLCGDALGIQAAGSTIGYENRLFDTSRVHTIEIVMDDWDGFISTCENEEYSVCAVVIDGESWKNVGIRAKGNTSLSSVSSMGSDRYSFKIEFDHYDSTKSYHGLDKLCLNNLIQDNTCMKDYLVYQLMDAYGVDAPLCSYAYITVNGEDWGLYLAVEGVEEAFLQRNYGTGYGELYKPDSMSFGGGRGNGKDFDMQEFQQQRAAGTFSDRESGSSEGKSAPASGGFSSASDVKLQYIDDDPSSYSNIFDNAKTEITDADRQRLIASLKSLSSYENLEDVVDMDEVLRYFVVHNFVVNGDSYTGSMIHNYYLYEEAGKLSMIPWDYNLAFGTFSGGSAAASVNDPIDDVLSDRPMQAWIFSDEAYTRMYHALYAEFLNSVDISGIIEEAHTLIASYVEKDPGKFCTYEEFQSGVQALKIFCSLREESVLGQLSGTIPSTSDGQNTGSGSLVNADGLELSAMGTMGGGRGGFGNGERPQDSSSRDSSGTQSGESQGTPAFPGEQPPDGFSGDGQPPEGAGLPERFDPSSQFPGSGQGSGDGSASETASGRQSGSRDLQMGDFSPPGSQSASAPSSNSTLILLGVSMLFLIGGLVFARKFRQK